MNTSGYDTKRICALNEKFPKYTHDAQHGSLQADVLFPPAIVHVLLLYAINITRKRMSLP